MTLPHNETLEIIKCASCGVAFAFPQSEVTRRRNDGKTFYCPSGHSNCWADTEEKRLKRQLEAEQRRAIYTRKALAEKEAEAAALEKQRRAWKGVSTKLKKKLSGCDC